MQTWNNIDLVWLIDNNAEEGMNVLMIIDTKITIYTWS